MPPQGRKRTSNSYESDDGFVAGSNDDGSASKPKKAKTTKAGNVTKSSKIGSSEEQIVGGGTKGVDGDEYWEVGLQVQFRWTWNAPCYPCELCTLSLGRKELGELEGW